MQVTLNFPPGIQRFDATALITTGPKSQLILAPNALNQVTIDPSVLNLDLLLASGFTPAMPTGTTAQRPAQPYAGQQYIDTTLGYVITRNPANTAWWNSTGTVV